MKLIVLFTSSILLATACSGRISDTASLDNGGVISVDGSISNVSSTGGSSASIATTEEVPTSTGGSTSSVTTASQESTGGIAPIIVTGGSSSVTPETGGSSTAPVNSTGGSVAVGTTGGSGAIIATGGSSPSCSLEKMEDLSMYTTYSSIQAGSNGFFILGFGVNASNNPDVTLAKFQYWSLSTKAMDREYYSTLNSWLISGGGSDEGFLMMIGGPSTHGDYIAPTAFDPNGIYQVSGNLGWSLPSTQSNPLGEVYMTPMQGRNIVAVSGGSKRQLLWRKKNTQAEPYTLMSNIVADDHFETAELQYTWSEDGNLFPNQLMAAATPSDNVLVAVSKSCNVIPIEGCPEYGWDLMFWDSKLSLAQRDVKIVHTSDGLSGHVSSIFPVVDGFDVQIGQRLVRYSRDGVEGRSIDLPTNVRRITRFRDGYVMIMTVADNLKELQLLRTTIDGVVLETVPFSSDYDRYELSIGDIAVVGDDTLVFTWSSLSSDRSTLAFFHCRD